MARRHVKAKFAILFIAAKYESYSGDMMADAKKYFIHDNGSRPFMVVITGLVASVFRVLPDHHYDRPECYRDKPEIAIECLEIFIGESPMCAMTVYSGGHGPEFSGNTILLRIVDDKYVWIGNRGIRSFTSATRVIDFISLVGNNDVPYPYTVDIHGNVRLLLDNVVLKPGFKFDLATCNNPYIWFYENNQLCEWPVLDPDHVYIPGYNGVLAYYHVDKAYNRERYILKYSADPAKEYDRFASRDSFDHMIIALVENGVIVEKLWTRQAFIALMNKFGEEHGFEHFATEEISPRFE